MTLVSTIIRDAYRQSNLIGINAAVTDAQNDEGLRYLNRILKASYGNDASEALQQLPLGQENISRPQGYPWYGNNPGGNWFVPKQAQLMCNITEPVAVFLHPDPNDGSRFGVSDIAGNFSTNNLVVFGNGRNIEDAPSITLNTDGVDRQWFYRQDTANWYKLTDLVLTDPLPFPEEFDDYFITLTATRLNPSYGAVLDPQSQSAFQKAKREFSARYHQVIQTPVELGLIRMPNTTADRYYWSQGGYWANPTDLFNAGMPGGWAGGYGFF